jgi:hypothetical protein
LLIGICKGDNFKENVSFLKSKESAKPGNDNSPF